ncbi:HalOD1 output domain-containing protein [Halopiger goleimassiliensis]|uniref:HalOD1 output domain-containing protein n=1 Tax=Halopiger goleimassiliensis TaxID=1293048 RepID=UPI0006778AFA|nr:HalOD1 output domain-containing protein [Halopiger goleimassiliensis]
MHPPDDPSTTGGGGPPSQAIIRAIADREGVEVTDIEPPAYQPLYSVVNPEALDRLFRPSGERAAGTVIRLEYEGYEVTVRGDGRVEVRDSSGADDAVRRSIEE